MTIPDQALAPDEYLICYNLGFGWFTVTRSLLVDGGAWLELSPVVPVHLSAFAMTIHGVHLTAGDKYGIIKSEAGCDSLGAGGDSVAVCTACVWSARFEVVNPSARPWGCVWAAALRLVEVPSEEQISCGSGRFLALRLMQRGKGGVLQGSFRQLGTTRKGGWGGFHPPTHPP